MAGELANLNSAIGSLNTAVAKVSADVAALKANAGVDPVQVQAAADKINEIATQLNTL